ncbi:unnamed protein product [Menidia menidia]|uniref:(Atlantic silverside) hypothetical protein n=1 Tax=Menidia menidia TaxID=238744 RepID=A0A8S4BEX7_9TELE|nr:unnamed protein product [Menidia menidia]
MDDMSPQQQQQDGLSKGGGQPDHKRRMRFQSYRRQSAPSLVITKALTRSKTLSRESFLVPVCPESCPLVQSLLSGSGRVFLLHGHAQLKTGMQTQDRHLFLFSDILVVAKAKSANHFKQKAQVRVCEMWTAGCLDEVCEGSTPPERGFVMGWPTWNCVAVFSSSEQKERWLSLLKSRIREEKESEEPKTIPLRVYGKGINSFAVTKTLPVSNSDCTNEVIRLALQQFGIIVSTQTGVLPRFQESFLVPVCPESCPLVQSLLSGSGRAFLLHGHAQLKTGMQTQDRHLFLFSDILVVAKAKSANHFKQKAQVRVCEMWTAGCLDEVCEGSTPPERGFVMGWPTWNCVAVFSSSEQKERWLSLLKSRIREEKESEEPKTIPLRVYGKGINSFAVTKTLPVSNSDCTNEVIRLALQQFGIIGTCGDGHRREESSSRQSSSPANAAKDEQPFKPK